MLGYEPDWNNLFGRFASSAAGHDKNIIYVIIGADCEYVYLVDGKLKKLDNPKRKNRKHVNIWNRVAYDVIKKRDMGRLSDADIRKAIADIKK